MGCGECPAPPQLLQSRPTLSPCLAPAVSSLFVTFIFVHAAIPFVGPMTFFAASCLTSRPSSGHLWQRFRLVPRYPFKVHLSYPSVTNLLNIAGVGVIFAISTPVAATAATVLLGSTRTRRRAFRSLPQVAHVASVLAYFSTHNICSQYVTQLDLSVTNCCRVSATCFSSRSRCSRLWSS